MASIGDVFMSLIIDDSRFQADARRSGTKAGDVAGKGFAGRFSTAMTGIKLGAGIAAFNLLQDGIGLAIGKLDEAHEAFLEDEVSASRLALALKNNVTAWNGSTDAVEAYATAQGRLAFSDDEVRESIGQLIGITHDETEAMRLNSIAQDLARAKNISLAEASDIVTKAAQGNGRALKALGIDVTGVTDAAGFLDAIQRNVNGSAEAWAQTNEGRLAVSNTKVQESMEKIGGAIDEVSQILVPFVADVVVGAITAFGDFWDATESIRTTLAPIFKTVFGVIGDVIGAVFDIITGVIEKIGEAIQLARDLAAAVGDFATGKGNDVQPFKVSFFQKNGRSPTAAEIEQWRAGKLPGFAQGGIVPGRPGEPLMAVVHGGERILPRGMGGSMTIEVPVYLDGEVLTRVVSRRLADELHH